MTAPRTALFQRPGPPPGLPPMPMGTSKPPEGQPPEDAAGAPGDPITCPQCGCLIDPATGEAMDSGGEHGAPDAPPSKVSGTLTDMLGGGE